jgi:hypothetical protein
LKKIRKKNKNRFNAIILMTKIRIKMGREKRKKKIN